ncbi:hypothetical protein F2Q69_00026192 [Brassica cretica]|uniref:Uncharacterized protein n=1 Tax=Brassica cretica TaxID=69181 RepID=A0A8S9S892_BRACR|nr:hypothetical protein F2Q69_00026192 [Brassica cretica]
MSSSYDLFTNLGAVCCSNTAEVRLLTFRKGGKLISVDILLLDEQVPSRVAVYTHPRDHQLDPEWKMIRPDLGRIRNGCYTMPLMMKISLIFQSPSVLKSMEKKEVRYAISYESDVDTGNNRKEKHFF